MAIKETKTTALDELRAMTTVDCDTLDVEVARTLGPFEDCTSNQAIASAELLKPEHRGLMEEAVALAEELHDQFPSVTREQLGVEICMVKLQLRIIPFITGCVHVQTNPFYAYSEPDTIANGERILTIFARLQPSLLRSRVCIKIPSTWEGLLACEKLEQQGITTLATTLFTMEQAVLAAEVGCTYIAPYVNELKVHFDTTFKDPSPLFDLVVSISRSYEKHAITTQVLPASLTSIEEIMLLAGVQHITVAPPLLRQLALRDELDDISLFGQPYSTAQLYEERMPTYRDDEAGWRLAFTASAGGEGVRKLEQAINIFCNMQLNMEAMLKPRDG